MLPRALLRRFELLLVALFDGFGLLGLLRFLCGDGAGGGGVGQATGGEQGQCHGCQPQGFE